MYFMYVCINQHIQIALPLLASMDFLWMGCKLQNYSIKPSQDL